MGGGCGQRRRQRVCVAAVKGKGVDLCAEGSGERPGGDGHEAQRQADEGTATQRDRLVGHHKGQRQRLEEGDKRRARQGSGRARCFVQHINNTRLAFDRTEKEVSWKIGRYLDDDELRCLVRIAEGDLEGGHASDLSPAKVQAV